jgi:hypothetical protein
VRLDEILAPNERLNTVYCLTLVDKAAQINGRVVQLAIIPTVSGVGFIALAGVHCCGGYAVDSTVDCRACASRTAVITLIDAPKRPLGATKLRISDFGSKRHSR